MHEHSTKQLPSHSQVSQEDEIPQSRKDYLRRCLDSVHDITPDIRRVKEGKYPFRGKHLSRADVIFLLSEHHDEIGPADGSDLNQRTPKGLDLRGADLQREDLGRLPLNHMLAGLTEEEWFIATSDQCKMATTKLDDANFSEAHLHGATFCYASLRRANFSNADLNHADLFGADLRGASFYKTKLEGANLHGANLRGAKVSEAELEKAEVDHVLKDIVVERTVVPPWGAEKTKLPYTPNWLYNEYKSPRWLTGFGRTLLIPLLIGLITLLVTQAFDNISQKRQAEQAQQALVLQSNQKNLELKNNLLVRMSNTVANALSELQLIEYNQESNDINTALKNYDDGYRNLLINGSEIEAEVASYFPSSSGQEGQSCTNMSNNITDARYNHIVLAWDNYYRVVIQNFYDLESNTKMESRQLDDIYWIKDVFNIYGIAKYLFIRDQSSISDDDWNNLSTFSFIKKYNNTPYLVQAGDSSLWNNLVQIIDGYKSIIEQCILSLSIPELSVSPTPRI